MDLHKIVIGGILSFAVGLSGISAQNPILPPTAFIPDGEPHVFEYQGELRVFVYGSRDERVTDFCGYGHDVWSAPVDDLTQWTNHGEIFNVKQVWDIGYGKVEEQHFGAPDCVYNPATKKYYLYTFLGKLYQMDGKEGPKAGQPGVVSGYGSFGPKCVMAESDSPAGPFVNPVMCDWPSVNDRGTFDPSVLVWPQEDGSVRVFAYWGMFHGDCWAEIDPNDMHTIINGKTRKPDRNAWYRTLNNPALNGYSTLFEASSIKQVDRDKFVFICSANEFIPALTYFYGNSPEGPWHYGGRIIDNMRNWNGGNNHGSIVKVKDRWYVFYHRRTNNDFNRQAMVEPLDLRIEGDRVVIPPVEMTSQGVLTDGLDPFRCYYAGTICWTTPGVYINGLQRESDGMNPVVIEGQESRIGWKYFNFGPKPLSNADRLFLRLNMQSLAPCRMTLSVALPADADTPEKHMILKQVDLSKYIKADSAYHSISIPIDDLEENQALKAIGGLSGQKAFFLSFDNQNQRVALLREIEFVKGRRSRSVNPLQPVVVSEADHGSCSVLPSKGRGGESVKITVIPDTGYRLSHLEVLDSHGNGIDCTANAKAPYAPESYHFRMPADAVNVIATFEPDEKHQSATE